VPILFLFIFILFLLFLFASFSFSVSSEKTPVSSEITRVSSEETLFYGSTKRRAFYNDCTPPDVFYIFFEKMRGNLVGICIIS